MLIRVVSIRSISSRDFPWGVFISENYLALIPRAPIGLKKVGKGSLAELRMYSAEFWIKNCRRRVRKIPQSPLDASLFFSCNCRQWNGPLSHVPKSLLLNSASKASKDTISCISKTIKKWTSRFGKNLEKAYHIKNNKMYILSCPGSWAIPSAILGALPKLMLRTCSSIQQSRTRSEISK